MRVASNRNAWIWVAIAAITFATLSRTEAGLQNAKAYANPVLEFLIKSQANPTLANPAASHLFPRIPNRRSLSASAPSSMAGWNAVLPIFFVGLLTPLALLSISFLEPVGRIPASPQLSAFSARPPPLA